MRFDLAQILQCDIQALCRSTCVTFEFWSGSHIPAWLRAVCNSILPASSSRALYLRQVIDREFIRDYAWRYCKSKAAFAATGEDDEASHGRSRWFQPHCQYFGICAAFLPSEEASAFICRPGAVTRIHSSTSGDKVRPTTASVVVYGVESCLVGKCL